MKKKVLLLNISLRGGGAERITSGLINNLHNEYDFTLVLLSKDQEYEIPSHIEVVYLDNQYQGYSSIKAILRTPFLAMKLASICKEKSIDVVLSFMYRPNYIASLSKLLYSKPKIYISERNFPSKVHKGSSFSNKLSRFLIKSLYPNADLVIPNSFEASKDLKDNFGVKNLKVINNFIDIAKIASLSNDQSEYSFDKDYFYFVTVGSLSEQKNHELLIRAFKKASIDKAKLLIIGKGHLKVSLQNLILAENLEEKVNLLGFKSNPFSILKNCNCFVLSSKFEGFPNVMLESMAVGLPVISTDCQSGPREILAKDYLFDRQETKTLTNEKYGILVQNESIHSMSEALIKIYENKELEHKYSKLSYERALEFDKPILMSKFKSLFDE
ncbi:glycosyltransferase [Flammeovirga sp. SJP92]|uniref:glycosyltransferase n=1 Tax=Flammeovirga sp. SJP92 TaxID=1775430 RepID=UPI000788E133|nr:glycosyltransferase [Flammeovirga sp. SJP92]KXX68570.1 hypothetical protein AVL50_22685 [Flammeovirga sp. SJP92]